MTRHLLTHFRGNVVAYLALCVAIVGSGGSYAVAATSHHKRSTKHHSATTLAACVNNRTGEMILDRRGRCRRGRHKVTWSIRGRRGSTGAAGATGATGAMGATGAAGTPAPSIYASVDAGAAADGLQSVPENGLTVQSVGTGQYTVTITDPVCSQAANVMTLTPTSRYLSGGPLPPPGATPVAYISQEDLPTQFSVQTGFTSNGSFTAAGLDFQIQDTCMPASSDSSTP